MNRTRLLIQFVVACILAGAVNITGSMLDAVQAEYSVELAAGQMDIEGSQDYAVYRETVEQLETAANAAEGALSVYVVWCAADYIYQNQRRNKK